MHLVRTLSWSVLLLLTLAVAGYAVAMLLVPVWRGGFVVDLFAAKPVGATLHLGGGAVALALGVFQLNGAIRARFLSLHRRMGQIYVLAVMASGSAGLYLAVLSDGGMTAHFGFGAMAVLWLLTTAIAYSLIRQRNIARHREWMIRSYALTLAAVTLRFYLPLSLGNGIAFNDAYPVIAWACWVPNLIVAEIYIRATRATAAA